jgi:hypothetical protein
MTNPPATAKPRLGWVMALTSTAARVERDDPVGGAQRSNSSTRCPRLTAGAWTSLSAAIRAAPATGLPAR